ncbi:HupE/UreJ family protein [Acinetobacter pragensis]|uniref:HupE/UreJ family protein n=1 Tax=Acinetobacter pragensis TaxID=1806892 RepID=UPI003DA711C3
MSMLKRFFAVAVGSLPMIAMAHPGHVHESSFWNGFSHPFTGLDHLTMAIAFGVLLWKATQRWKVAGFFGMAVAMITGFILGQQQILPNVFAEYGIVLSLAVLATALLMKSNRIFAVAIMVLGSFHGVAHGNELGQSGHMLQLMLGMVSAMSIIYLMGLGLGALTEKYLPHGRKIIAALAAILAVIGLA